MIQITQVSVKIILRVRKEKYIVNIPSPDELSFTRNNTDTTEK